MTILVMNMIRGEPEEWVRIFNSAFPDMEVRIWPEVGNGDDIEFLAFGRPELDKLPPLPNLKLLLTVLAGVERVIGSPHLPDVPLVRAEPPGGDPMMTEYALTLALYHHRSLHVYRDNQARHEWKPAPHVPTPKRRVGVMGHGTLSRPVADALAALGFDVAAWARRPKADTDIQIFDGADGFTPFLARTDIAICMLPLTDETRHILDAKAFSLMPEGAAIINLGRGAHVATDDLIQALDGGQLSGASLDVTDPEPLGEDSPLWDHPRITILPHVARRPSVEQTAPQLVENIRRFLAGEPLEQLVDREARY